MRLIAVAVWMLGLASPTWAAIELFELDIDPQNSITGADNTYSHTKFGLSDNGVTFDATVHVVGSGSLSNTFGGSPVGLGVFGLLSSALNSGERLQFSLTISNVMNGTVTFLGFTELLFGSFDVGTDGGILSLDSSALTTGDNFLTAGAATAVLAPPQTAFFLIGDPDLSSNSFRADGIRASFSGSPAVPEPASCLMFAALLIGAIVCARRHAIDRQSDAVVS